MALPIKDTPILRGEDAIKFNQSIIDNENKRVSKEIVARMNANYEAIKRIERSRHHKL